MTTHNVKYLLTTAAVLSTWSWPHLSLLTKHEWPYLEKSVTDDPRIFKQCLVKTFQPIRVLKTRLGKMNQFASDELASYLPKHYYCKCGHWHRHILLQDLDSQEGTTIYEKNIVVVEFIFLLDIRSDLAILNVQWELREPTNICQLYDSTKEIVVYTDLALKCPSIA